MPTLTRTVGTIAELMAIDLTTIQVGEAVIVLGYWSAGDGGGGLFRATTEVPPNPDVFNALYIGVGNGRWWWRAYSGPIDIRWFGAQSNVQGVDQAPRIQAAITAALDQSHSTAVYVPAGEYLVQNSITIPRRDPKPLTLRGDGAGVSIIRASPNALAELVPLVTFEPHPAVDQSVRHLTVENLQFSRDDKGAVFVFKPTLPWEDPINPDKNFQTDRLIQSVFRNCYFYSKTNPSGNWGTQTPLFIEGAQNCVFDNIRCEGGESAFLLKMSSRCTVINFRTGLDRSQRNGIRITGSGSHTFINTRIEACGNKDLHAWGNGFTLEPYTYPSGRVSVPENIVVQDLTFEGKSTSPQINLRAGKNITFINVGIASPLGADQPLHNNQVGIRIGSEAHAIRFIGGYVSGMWSAELPSNQSINIADGASDIFFDGVRIGGSTPDKDVGIHSGAKRVRMDLIQFFSGQYRAFTMQSGVIPVPVLSVDNMVGTVRGSNIWRMKAQTINGLKDGYEGQVVALMCEAGAVIQLGGNLRLAGGEVFTPQSDDAVIQLLFQGSKWLELSRSMNA